MDGSCFEFQFWFCMRVSMPVFGMYNVWMWIGIWIRIGVLKSFIYSLIHFMTWVDILHIVYCMSRYQWKLFHNCIFHDMTRYECWHKYLSVQISYPCHDMVGMLLLFHEYECLPSILHADCMNWMAFQLWIAANTHLLLTSLTNLNFQSEETSFFFFFLIFCYDFQILMWFLPSTVWHIISCNIIPILRCCLFK